MKREVNNIIDIHDDDDDTQDDDEEEYIERWYVCHPQYHNVYLSRFSNVGSEERCLSSCLNSTANVYGEFVEMDFIPDEDQEGDSCLCQYLCESLLVIMKHCD